MELFAVQMSGDAEERLQWRDEDGDEEDRRDPSNVSNSFKAFTETVEALALQKSVIGFCILFTCLASIYNYLFFTICIKDFTVFNLNRKPQFFGCTVLN